MVTDPYVVGPDEPLDSVLLTLAERRIGCALVAENGKLTGIFTTTDAALMLGRQLRSRHSSGEPETT
jgi:CBS domain-containing protein